MIGCLGPTEDGIVVRADESGPAATIQRIETKSAQQAAATKPRTGRKSSQRAENGLKTIQRKYVLAVCEGMV